MNIWKSYLEATNLRVAQKEYIDERVLEDDMVREVEERDENAGDDCYLDEIYQPVETTSTGLVAVYLTKVLRRLTPTSIGVLFLKYLTTNCINNASLDLI